MNNSGFSESGRERVSPNRQRSSAQEITIIALHDTVSIADKNGRYTTYQTILNIADALAPQFFGRLNLLERVHESDLAIEYRQKADLESLEKNETILPSSLVRQDITKWRNYLNQSQVEDYNAVLKRLDKLEGVLQELEPVAHTENRLIQRDMSIGEDLPTATKGGHYLDLALPHGRVLRLRLIHPDAPEDITGVDILYEHHNVEAECARIVVAQYKRWENQTLYTTQSNVEDQITKLECTFCQNNYCKTPDGDLDRHLYRLNYCSAFLRPTNKLQSSNSRFASIGYHIPICRVKQLWEDTTIGKKLTYERIKNESLTQRTFEEMFFNEMLGSRWVSYNELQAFYDQYRFLRLGETVKIYAQDITPTQKNLMQAQLF